MPSTAPCPLQLLVKCSGIALTDHQASEKIAPDSTGRGGTGGQIRLGSNISADNGRYGHIAMRTAFGLGSFSVR